jgi:hypothetical protein
MHTEHLANVRPGRVGAAWLVAVATTSLLLFAFVAAGLVPPDGTGTGGPGVFAAQALGFAAGGFFAGIRGVSAPILHGVALGLVSLLVAALLSGLSAAVAPGTQAAVYLSLTAVASLATQIAAAVIGALVGYNIAVRGRPGLGEPEPPG